jgi:hypothetical protein
MKKKGEKTSFYSEENERVLRALLILSLSDEE